MRYGSFPRKGSGIRHYFGLWFLLASSVVGLAVGAKTAVKKKNTFFQTGSRRGRHQ